LHFKRQGARLPVHESAGISVISSFRNTSGRDGLAFKNVKLFLREPLAIAAWDFNLAELFYLYFPIRDKNKQ
jgi:hypothetical protein